MAGKKTVPNQKIRTWREIHERNEAQEKTSWTTAREIVSQGLAEGYSASTVYYWIDEIIRESNKASARRSTRRRNEQLVRENAKDPITYDRQYKRLTRNPSICLATIFSEREHADLETITDEIQARCEQVQFRPTTVQRVLSKYVELALGPPYLTKTTDGIYSVTQEPATDNDER